MPLIDGLTLTRWLMVGMIVVWSFVCLRILEVETSGYVVLVIFGIVLVGRIVSFRSVAVDRLARKL